MDILILLIFMQSLLRTSFGHCITFDNKSNRDIVVTLDPYVSVLDKYNRNRYNESQLLEMIKFVSTRFSCFHIQFTEDDFEEETSISLLPQVIAKYNINRKQNPPLQVWLSISEDTLTSTKFPLKLTKRLLNESDFINQIYNDTVTIVLIPFNLFSSWEYTQTVETSHSRSFTELKNYKWGIIYNEMVSGYCSNQGKMTKFVELKPDFVLISVVSLSDTDSHKDTLIQKLNQTLIDCRSATDGVLDIGIVASCHDTCPKGRISISEQVSCWNKIQNWAKSANITVILNQAFDTPYQDQVVRKTSGWWRYSEDNYQDYLDISRLQRKSDLDDKFDENHNSVNLTVLKNPISFKSQYFGVVFSLFDKDKTQDHSQEATLKLKPMLTALSTKFGKAMILFDDHSRPNVLSVGYALRVLTIYQVETEVIALLMPDVDLSKFFDGSLQEAAKQYNVKNNLVSTYVVAFIGNSTKMLANYIKNVVLGTQNRTTYKLGYAFSVSFCGNLDENDKNLVQEIVDDADVVYFYYEEDIGTINLGVTRMFRQRLILFQNCQNFVQNIQSKSTEKDVAFVLLHYDVVSHNFYKDSLQIFNFVRYWELMSKWANDTKTTVIMPNLIDGTRTWPYFPIHKTAFGWYRRNPNIDNLSMKDVWIDKKTDAIKRISENMPNPGVSGFSTLEIALFSGIPLILCICISLLVIWLMRKHYRQVNQLSRLEMQHFFYGTTLPQNYESLPKSTGELPAQCLPYDKNHYEIPSSQFTVDHTSVLGKGAYGLVISGKVQKDSEFVNVAVKTLNPENYEKTALKDLLTEIKVLGYVGKHRNIVELLGAYTNELKMRKVYAFLELCELGSLAKYLREIRPSGHETEDIRNANKSTEYINTIVTEHRAALDPSVLEDLHRWTAQIANGMSFLASKNVVHADLATRNILLDRNRDVKICDFGLSRRMFNYSNYVKQQQEPLPWRWMAPESLRLLEFNEKSDVWAYGVTLWEMYTLGDQPYPGLSYESNFVELLERGLRLSEPKYNDENMYELMKECWNVNPERRPTFEDIESRFCDYLEVVEKT